MFDKKKKLLTQEVQTYRLHQFIVNTSFNILVKSQRIIFNNFIFLNIE
jgi:hypothetical protein